jgi:SAM-dependent methyltransferase
VSDPELAAHFEDLHRASDDPWSVDTRWYEQRKRGLSLALLRQPTYGRAFEPGCSVGAFTELLAGRCAELLSWDASTAAVGTCRRRMAGADHVTVQSATMPSAWPDGRFDLIVLGEVGYYLSAADLDEVLDHIGRSLAPGGDLLAVHWRQVADDFRLDGGDDVHRRIAARPELRSAARYVDDDFRADVFVRSA